MIASRDGPGLLTLNLLPGPVRVCRSLRRIVLHYSKFLNAWKLLVAFILEQPCEWKMLGSHFFPSEFYLA